MIRWKKKDKQLTRGEVEWIFALKDGSQQAHYNLHYGRYDDEPTEYTIVSILSTMMEKVGWTEAIRGLRQDQNMITMMRKKSDMPLNEWLFIAIRSWCIHRDIYWMEEHAPSCWQEWVDIAREAWAKEEKENGAKIDY